MTKPPNGKVPASALVTVQTGTYKGRPYVIQLERAAAAALNEAQHDHVISVYPPLGGNRSLVAQANLKANPAAYGSSLKPSQILYPGHSTHGYGTCVDIQAGNAWFAEHCHEYGFVRESPAGETNHYRYLHPTWAAAPVKPPTTTASTGGVTAPKGPADMAAPLVHNYKANAKSNLWFRTWEFTTEETAVAAVAVEWMNEAGQSATIAANGTQLNAQRAASRGRLAAFLAALKASK